MGMIAGATAVFVVSLTSILSLFILRAWEVRRGARVLPELRAYADGFALRCKRILLHWDAVL